MNNGGSDFKLGLIRFELIEVNQQLLQPCFALRGFFFGQHDRHQFLVQGQGQPGRKWKHFFECPSGFFDGKMLVHFRQGFYRSFDFVVIPFRTYVIIKNTSKSRTQFKTIINSIVFYLS